MAWDLAAPDALDALLTLAATISSVTVADGPLVNQTATRALVIGYSDARVEAIEHDMDETANYTSTQADKFIINCRAESAVTTTVSAARADAYSLVAALARLIESDPTLGLDSLMQAVVCGVRYSPIEIQRGHFAAVRFGVCCESFTE